MDDERLKHQALYDLLRADFSPQTEEEMTRAVEIAKANEGRMRYLPDIMRDDLAYLIDRLEW